MFLLVDGYSEENPEGEVFGTGRHFWGVPKLELFLGEKDKEKARGLFRAGFHSIPAKISRLF